MDRHDIRDRARPGDSVGSSSAGDFSGTGAASTRARERFPAPINRPRIVHVSADFPDPIDTFKTPVVRTLVDLTSDRFRHEVVSLNRRSPTMLEFGRGLLAGLGAPKLAIGAQSFAYGQALIYQAPPRGLFHATMLRRLGDWLAGTYAGRAAPDVLIGHKLTIEGVAVRRASSRLGVPFAVCIQGDTDTKILAARPDLATEFATVFHEAAVVFPFTPWALNQFEQRFGPRTKPTIMLPCPTDLDTPTPPRPDGDGLVTVFHLKNQRRKNLRGMVAALRLLDEAEHGLRLAIIGGGSEQDLRQCREVVQGLCTVMFEGPLDRSALRERLNRASCLVLPSLRESFGLVFIEALFAGVPVIYPKSTAIDGYFDGASFAIGVDAKDPVAIADAMKKATREEGALKADLAQWQQSAHAGQFRRGAIADSFARGLAASVPAREGAPA